MKTHGQYKYKTQSEVNKGHLVPVSVMYVFVCEREDVCLWLRGGGGACVTVLQGDGM